MDAALLAAGAALIAGLALGGIELREHQRPGQYQRLDLRFGRDVTPAAVLAVLNRIAGQHRFACVVLETRANHDGIHHVVASDQATLDVLRTALRAHLPAAALESVPTATADPPIAGGAIRLRGRLRTLQSETPEEVSAALLAGLQPLGAREQIVLRLLVRPAQPLTVPPAHEGHFIEPEGRRRLRVKNEGSVVRAHGTLAVTAGHPRRAAHLLACVTSALRTRNTAYGQLRTLPRPAFWLKWLLTRRSFWFGDRYGASELAGLVAWPMNAPVLPGVALGTSPRRMPSGRIPAEGHVLGTATWPGSERPIAQPWSAPCHTGSSPGQPASANRHS